MPVGIGFGLNPVKLARIKQGGNVPPSFTLPGSNIDLLQDSSNKTYLDWATNISAGPPETEGHQTLDFIVTNNNNAIFDEQPTISPTGTLTFKLSQAIGGTATVTVLLHDSGGVGGGGSDTSSAKTFMITNRVFYVEAPSLSFAFRADAAGTLHQDSARTTATTTGGQPVGSWKSYINNKYITQTDNAKRPSYQTPIQNSKPALLFDNDDDFLQITSEASLENATKFTLLAVVKGGTPTQRSIFDATLTQFGVEIADGSTKGYTGSSNHGTFYDVANTPAQILILIYDGTQATDADRLKLYKNGIQQTLTFTGTIPASINGTNGFTVGKR